MSSSQRLLPQHTSHGSFSRFMKVILWFFLTLLNISMVQHLCGSYLCNSSHELFRLWRLVVLPTVMVVCWYTLLDSIVAWFIDIPLEEHIKAVREFSFANSLSEDLRKEMISDLTQRGSGDIEPKRGFAILSLFDKELQSRIKANLFTDHLQKLYLFKGVSPAFLFQLVAELEVKTVKPNKVVIAANEFPSKFYIGWKGGVVREINQGSSSGIRELGVYGEVGVLCFVSQPYTFRATTQSVLLSINRIELLRLLEIQRWELRIMLENVLEEVFKEDLSILRTNEAVEQCFLDNNIVLSIKRLRTCYANAIPDNDQDLLETAHKFSGGQVDIFISGLKETPLLMAVRCNNIKAADYLLQSNARTDIPDSTGITARELAISDGSEEMRQLFNSYGA
ncbi:hypothetical protein KSS87_009794 [Heliosperma pusillum]|nr:hypothetical protein KSS87_009794 [Heliosperma pusillum]